MKRAHYLFFFFICRYSFPCRRISDAGCFSTAKSTPLPPFPRLSNPQLSLQILLLKARGMFLILPFLAFLFLLLLIILIPIFHLLGIINSSSILSSSVAQVYIDSAIRRQLPLPFPLPLFPSFSSS